ncbi:uncharacterized protein CCOS01_14763 [Colletotrichum costaricense]|uniref:Uncharacterized protein n=1 Tax=Colletotrichum costaricense TaxID=1209916 RepID=A0AAJ0DUH6_9PEZI|nr:uncharacterized protein CCOS01_14763 [Colletotrichum costaricense]KAI3539486.1 hypothetical protein CSPX01_08932 [Colletotrichum filicis]KAK1512523.1 hypothetical protein CCOS01_14763 [Colletotrichum costaricense]
MQRVEIDDGETEDIFYSLNTAWQLEAVSEDDQHLYEFGLASHGALGLPNTFHRPALTNQAHHLASLGHTCTSGNTSSGL